MPTLIDVQVVPVPPPPVPGLRRMTAPPRGTAVDKQLMKVIGTNLRHARVAAGLSQRDVFKLTGIQPAMQVDVERGARNLTVRSLAKLAAAVGVTVAEIVTPPAKTRKPPTP